MATQQKGYAGPGGSYYSSYVPEIAGPQMPQKYDKTGPNYRTFGEQPGYVYYPLQDKYIPDPKEQKKFAESNGFTEKKKGLQEALLPVAATAGTIEIARGLSTNPGEFIGGIGTAAESLGSKVGGLFGLGSETANAGSQVASNLGNLDLAADGAGSLFGTGGTAAGSTGSAGASSISSSAGSALGAAAPYLGAAGAGLSAYQIGDSLIKGKKMGTTGGALSGAGLGAGLAAAAPLVGLGPIGWAGLGLMALGGGLGGGLLGQFGHGKNFYEGEDRKNFANSLNQKFGPNAVDVEKFRSDPGSYTYDLNSPGKLKELGGGQGLAYLLGAGDIGSKGFTDASSRFANDIKGGASVSELYNKFGFDKDKALAALGSSTLDAQRKAELQNGINDAFSGATASNPLNQGLLGLLKSGDKMSNGKTYISPGVYR